MYHSKITLIMVVIQQVRLNVYVVVEDDIFIEFNN